MYVWLKKANGNLSEGAREQDIPQGSSLLCLPWLSPRPLQRLFNPLQPALVCRYEAVSTEMQTHVDKHKFSKAGKEETTALENRK